jgi:hypothetical protein
MGEVMEIVEQFKMARKPKPVKVHKTEDELLFIKSIGQYHEETRRIPKEVMLRRYLNASMHRENWNGMDKYTIIGAIQKELRDLKGKK